MAAALKFLGGIVAPGWAARSWQGAPGGFPSTAFEWGYCAGVGSLALVGLALIVSAVRS